MQNFNLVITTQRGNERNCVREMNRLVIDAKGPPVHMKRTRFPGLILAFSEGDPIELCRSLRPLIEYDPWDLRFILKITPVQVTVAAETSVIKDAVGSLAAAIPDKESFRISVNKRGSEMSSADIIKEAASTVKRRVNLDSPAWIIQIEIIDDRAGISLLTDEDIISVTKMQEKAMQSEREEPEPPK
ncbi:MAG: THUMP domain-containing protein [Candidatus Methanomethylicus sp.]|nr:THUMP domain-containing protein [Candidatus Methanomethylicus sp.]